MLQVRKAAVLGAGVMGAQIAAHLVNAGIPTLLFDLPAKEGNPNGIVGKAILNLKKLKPAPLAYPAKADSIIPATYQQNLEALRDCDIVIEAIAERLDWKESLYQQIAPYLSATAYLASNTSGLSIKSLSSVLPVELQKRFCGVHFFNPPRYMHLAELTPGPTTEAVVLDNWESFLTSALGKGVIRAKDTPNFVANRVGVFGILSMIHRALEFNIPFEVVDELTGKNFGRAKSALFRTMDVVGLDVLAHVIQTMMDYLPEDPWHQYYQVPTFVSELIKKGALGQKTGAGIYRKDGKNILVLDLNNQNYRLADKKADQEVLALLKITDPVERLAALHHHSNPQAKFLWACLSDMFHYCAYHLQDIAHNVRDLDLAMRWGFGWREGVFELWQSASWEQIAKWVSDDIADGKALVKNTLPVWVSQCEKTQGPYVQGKAFDPSQNDFVARSDLPVYTRQLFPDKVITEIFNEGETILDTAAVRLWTLDQQIAILSFKSKMNAVGDDVLDGILASIKIAEEKYQALVIWQREGDNFSVGANLKMVGEVYAKQGIDGIRPVVEKFQRTSMALRYAQVPTIAVIKGMVLGGGCELMMHCDRTVAAFESYIGLVEIGVGLLPAGGGCKEFALRAAQEARGDNPYRDLQAYFKQIAMGEVSSSAPDARNRNYLRASDVIVMNSYEILYVALAQAKALAESAYRPPMPPMISVAGKAGIANFQMMLVNMREGNFISDYDYEISLTIAEVLCGGQIENNLLVDEEWFLRLEREAFLKLAAQPKTQERIAHMLSTGKPLRN